MKKLHAKSPCCRTGVIKFGNRRRQCVKCRKTWRIRKKKRGRKAARVSHTFVAQYIDNERLTSYVLARIRKTKSKDQRERAIRKSLAHFVHATHWPTLPFGEPVIAIADAMIITINKKLYAFHFILIRRILDTRAIIAPSYVCEGAESYESWWNAFNQLPQSVLASIQAVVCDSQPGFRYVARRRSWLIQQCNFHLIARVQGRRSRWVKSRHRAEGEHVYSLVNKIITNPNEEAILDAVREVWELSQTTHSRNLKTYLSGFSRRYWEYRTYLQYPELRLPRTTNSAESLIGCVRKLNRKAHGFRTIKSLTLWVHALLKKKKSVTCNGFYQPN